MAKKFVWCDSYYIKFHDLFRQGMSWSQACNALGLSPAVMDVWCDKKPVLKQMRAEQRKRRKAIKSGKELPPNEGEHFLEYVYKRLPVNLQKVWDQMEAYENEPNAERKLERLLEGRGVRVRQQLFMHALVMRNFSVSEACRVTNVSLAQYNTWKTTDPDFLALTDTVIQMKKDFCEGALMDLVAKRDSPAVLFVNRTLNRDRGYDTKHTVEHQVKDERNTIDLDKLQNAPPELLRMLLEYHRSQERQQLPPVVVDSERVDLDPDDE